MKKVYDKKSGNLLKEIDADNNLTEYEYDILGRIAAQKKKDGLSKVSIEYDDNRLTTSVTDELGCVTVNQFDNLGRLVKISKTADEKTITTLLLYDNYDRVLELSEPFEGAEKSIDSVARSIYEYDKLGRIIKSKDADSRIITYLYIDSLNMTEINKGELEIEQIYKDNLGNIIKHKKWIKQETAHWAVLYRFLFANN